MKNNTVDPRNIYGRINEDKSINKSIREKKNCRFANNLCLGVKNGTLTCLFKKTE